MPRPPFTRRVRWSGPHRTFSPDQAVLDEHVQLLPDELEAIRLSDLERLYQEAAARQMNVSRPTYGRILSAAREKIADALINGKTLTLLPESEHVEQAPEAAMTGNVAALTRNQAIAPTPHSGQQQVTLFTIHGGTIVSEEIIEPEDGQGWRGSLGSVLAQKGVSHLLAPTPGHGIRRGLASHGITLVTVPAGSARERVEEFLARQYGPRLGTKGP